MNIAQTLGWTLVHSIWEIAAIAALFFVAGVFLRGSSAKVRYAVALCALAACLALPVTTAIVLSPARAVPAQVASTIAERDAAPVLKATISPAASFTSVAPRDSISEAIPIVKTLHERIEPILPSLVLCWLIGLALMSMRLIGGLFAIYRLRTTAEPGPDSKWQNLTNDLATRLNVKQPIQFMLSHRVETPAVVGLLKAVVLFPASALTTLSQGQVEALIAHEIAHIRRYDMIVNLIQTMVETILFYHPAVWWISSVVRAEREHCCDDLAIQAVGDRETYARALVGLEQLRIAPQLAMSANRGSLLARIQRILLEPRGRTTPATTWATLILVIGITVGLAQNLPASQDKDKPGNVKGSVLTKDGLPAASAEIYIQTNDGPGMPWSLHEATADSNGRFSFDLRPHQSFQVLAEYKNEQMGSFSMLEDLLSKKVNLPTAPISISLLPMRKFNVFVADKVGAPVAGLRITPPLIGGRGGLFQVTPAVGDRFSAVTDNAGNASFDSIGGFAFMWLHTDDPRFASMLQQPANQISKKSKVESYVAEPPCQVAGTVTLDGKPLSGVEVRDGYGYNPEVLTDENGRFKFERETHGPHRLITLLTGKLRDMYVAEPARVYLQPAKYAEVSIKLIKGGLIYGKVMADNDKPAPYALTQIVNKASHRLMDGSLEIAPDGSYKLRLPAGTYEVNVSRNFQDGVQQNITVKDGQSQEVTIHAPSIVGIAEISAKVIDADGQPVPWVSVEYSYQANPHMRLSGRGFTRDDGRTWLFVPEKLLATLDVRVQKGDQFSDLGAKPKNGVLVLKLHRVRLASVEGLITDEQGNPVTNAWVTINPYQGGFYGDSTWGLFNKSTDEKGRYRIEGIYPGLSTSFLVRADGYADTQTSKWTIKGGSTQTLPTIILKPAAKIEGQVIDQHGKPIPQAQVIAENSIRATHGEYRTDKNGRFEIDTLQPGEVRLGIYKGYKEIHVQSQTGTDKVYKLKI